MSTPNIKTLAERIGLGDVEVPPTVAEFINKLLGEAVAAEREACAKVCDALSKSYPIGLREQTCAAAIRARGQA